MLMVLCQGLLSATTPLFLLQSSQTLWFPHWYLQALSCLRPDRKNWGTLDWARHLPLARSTPCLSLLVPGSWCLSCTPACLAFWLIISPWLQEMRLPPSLLCVHVMCWTTPLSGLLVTTCLPIPPTSIGTHGLLAYSVLRFWIHRYLSAHLAWHPYFVEASGPFVSYNLRLWTQRLASTFLVFLSCIFSVS